MLIITIISNYSFWLYPSILYYYFIVIIINISIHDKDIMLMRDKIKVIAIKLRVNYELINSITSFVLKIKTFIFSTPKNNQLPVLLLNFWIINKYNWSYTVSHLDIKDHICVGICCNQSSNFVIKVAHRTGCNLIKVVWHLTTYNSIPLSLSSQSNQFH